MTTKSKLRGHDIECINGEWIYCDNKKPTAGNYQDRPCGFCGRHSTEDGHDDCLGTLPGVMNACCGHGDIRDVYVQFLDGFSVYRDDAIVIQNILKKYREQEMVNEKRKKENDKMHPDVLQKIPAAMKVLKQ